MATLDDLYREPGKAEPIAGKSVRSMPSDFTPNQVGGRIDRSLADYAEAVGRGVACMDGIGYSVPKLPSKCESCSPDASYHLGSLPANRIRFIEGAPPFAVEVRSENGYGPEAEAEMAARRAAYFAVGTAVVWGVDPIAAAIHVSRFSLPDRPTTYTRGLARRDRARSARSAG